ncbi:hypothetical protein, partial [Candidatus Hakubella thermalkaliphila]|uniref:hypothetical protein n=1 Tax=Candidatus Hakubella thermalkaliphila TaxID=2754717 RepID=UPI001C61340C
QREISKVFNPIYYPLCPPNSCLWYPDTRLSKESPMRRGAPRRMKIGLFSRERYVKNVFGPITRP